MKNVTIAGRLTRDAEIRTTQGGDKIGSFSVAVDDRSGREKTTLFFDCALWGKRAESLAQYLTKGSSVCVTGDLGKREHEGKTYLQVRVDNVTLLGGGDKSDGGSVRSQGSDRMAGGGNREPSPFDDDTIPF